MKKVFLSLLCLGLISAIQLHAESYPPHQISGKLSNVPGNTIAISVLNFAAGYMECIDTIALDGGKFGFDIPSPAITIIYIQAGPMTGLTERQREQQILLVAVPGEKAIINGTIDKYTITGSPFYNDFNEVIQAMQPIQKRYVDIQCKYQPLFRAEDCNRDSIRDQFGAEMSVYREAMSDFALRYIQSHPDQEAAAILIPNIAPKDRTKAINALSDKAKTARMVEFYAPLLRNVPKEDTKEETVDIPKQTFPTIEAGNPAPDFTLKDLNSNDFSLSSLRGKYVVLDFWGNWCGWCIKGIPDMKEAYAKHKDKVEFVGIDCNDTQEVWKKAVAKYELPWIQVYNSGVPENVASKYNVGGYPSKYIIDPEGKLIKIVVGEDPVFYTFLDELLK